MRLPKVRICIPFPNNGDLMTRCKRSLDALIDSNLVDVKDSIHPVQGASISLLRSNGVNLGKSTEAKQNGFGFDYYLALDSDIEFKPADVKALIDRDVDIVCGGYQYRSNRDFAVAGYYARGIPGTIDENNFLHWSETGLRQVDWVGAGFLLVKAQVFEMLEYPWFREAVIRCEINGVLHSIWVGEDVGFCQAAKKAGLAIHCDMDVKVNHLTAEPFKSADQYGPEEAHQQAIDALSKVSSIVDAFYNVAKEYESVVQGLQKLC